MWKGHYYFPSQAKAFTGVFLKDFISFNTSHTDHLLFPNHYSLKAKYILFTLCDTINYLCFSLRQQKPFSKTLKSHINTLFVAQAFSQIEMLQIPWFYAHFPQIRPHTFGVFGRILVIDSTKHKEKNGQKLCGFKLCLALQVCEV